MGRIEGVLSFGAEYRDVLAIFVLISKWLKEGNEYEIYVNDLF